VSSPVSSALLRPGLALGPYPEQQRPRPGWLDRAAGALEDRIARRTPSRGALVAFTHRVEARRASLVDASARALAEAILPLRRRLRGGGLAEDALAESFGLLELLSPEPTPGETTPPSSLLERAAR